MANTVTDSTLSERRRFLKAAGAVGLGGLAGCMGSDDDSDADDGGDDGADDGESSDEGGETVQWTMGTSGPDSATHASGVAMSQVLSEESDSIDMSAQTTGGTAANPQLIDNGDIDVAQSTSWGVVRANEGDEPYGEPMGKTMTQVLPFMSLEYYLVKRDVEELSDIETVSDIPQDGSINMAFGQRGGTNHFTGLDGLKLSGIENPREKFNIRSMSWGDQGAALRDGRLDIGIVYSVSGVVLAGWEQELDATQAVDVVEWEFDESDVEESGLPYFYIDASADPWEQELSSDSIPSLGVGYETVFSEDVSQELGYEFVSTVHDNVEAVRDASSVLQGAGEELTQKLMLASESAPVHPGAEQYMKEEDIWSDELTTLDEYDG